MAQASWARKLAAVDHHASFETEDATLASGAVNSNEVCGNPLSRIVGNSAGLRRVFDIVLLVADQRHVLIKGETGTGKQLIAEAIHQCGDRSKGPFIRVNCAAISSGLLESELFGHERGAYTGAVARSIGLFERANRGTLFLDEIGDLPLELQPKILRVMQERKFERLGGSATIHTDVRVICATHQNLVEILPVQTIRRALQGFSSGQYVDMSTSVGGAQLPRRSYLIFRSLTINKLESRTQKRVPLYRFINRH
jgi:transcriptional regulator with GAF, ATPase, and Fis domain